jgi:uncharacterized protein (TIGR02284 family)
MKTTIRSINSLLSSLIETCQDGQEGYQHAADQVKNIELKLLFSGLASQRRHFIAELQSLERTLGKTPAEEGSGAGALHRGWMDLKAALTGGDEHALLAECERGEDAAISEYREALTHDEAPAKIRSVIQQQYSLLRSAHDRVRSMRNQFAS